MRRHIDGQALRSWFFGIALGLAAAAWVLTMPACGAKISQEGGTASVHQKITTTVAPDGTVTRTEDVGGSSKGISGAASGDEKASLSGDGAPAPFTLPSQVGTRPAGVQPSTAPFAGFAKGADWAVVLMRILVALAGVGLGFRAYLAATTAQPKQAVLSASGAAALVLAAVFWELAMLIVVSVLVVGAGYILWQHFDQAKVRTMRGNAFGALRSAADAALAGGPDAWRAWWANFVKSAEPSEIATLRKAVQGDYPTAPPPMPDVPDAGARP